MIDDLDKTIKALLLHELRGTNVEISFETPDAQFRPKIKPPAINLFLYDIRENRELRSNEISRDRSPDNKIISQPNPVRVDCSYLVSAWVGDGSNTSTEQEHQLLGDTMTVLLKYPKLPLEFRQGRLKNQEQVPPTATLQPGRLQSIGEFWQALGGNPKAAFDYTVTIGLQPFAPTSEGLVEEMKVVIEDRQGSEEMTLVVDYPVELFRKRQFRKRQ
jgi:hypothetical protein